jgi:hypothetical protein
MGWCTVGLAWNQRELATDGLRPAPPAIRELVDKTASHIGKRGSDGASLEDKCA